MKTFEELKKEQEILLKQKSEYEQGAKRLAELNIQLENIKKLIELADKITAPLKPNVVD